MNYSSEGCICGLSRRAKDTEAFCDKIDLYKSFENMFCTLDLEVKCTHCYITLIYCNNHYFAVLFQLSWFITINFTSQIYNYMN